MERYLGTYSPLKYEQFILCTKVNDLSGVDPVTLRKYALEFKAYIALNGKRKRMVILWKFLFINCFIWIL